MRRLTTQQIGYAHGQGAQAEIERCIAFYAKLFMKISKLDWPQVQEVASTFNTLICAKWPRYHQELQGTGLHSRHVLAILHVSLLNAERCGGRC